MKKFDVVIIGSGLGGLVTASILTKNNYKVCVLEKNEQFGGALQVFKRDDVILDTGVHYLGSLAKGENLYQFFKYLGLLDKLKLKQMDTNGFDQISFGDSNEIYCWANGYKHFEDTLKQKFPDESDAISLYIEKVQETCKSLELYNLKVPTAPDFYAWYNTLNAYDFLRSITSNERLIAVLLGNNLLYYADKEKTSFYVHALIVNSYICSAWRCVDGGQQIANILVRNIRRNGGKVLRNAEVNKIIVKDNLVTAAQLTNGNFIYAKQFVSNVNPSLTLDLIEADVVRASYKNRIKSIENSMSAFTMHLILKKNCFPYFNHNRYHFTAENIWCNTDYKTENWPENLMIFTPANSQNDKYAESLSIMCSMKFDEVAEWSDTFPVVPEQSIRNPKYLEWKKEKENRILEIVFKLYPELKGNIVSSYASSPLTYRDYLNTKNGTAYGHKQDCKHPVDSYISHRTKLPNLFLTGQDINLHGVLGVTISAFLSASSFVDISKLLQEVRES